MRAGRSGAGVLAAPDPAALRRPRLAQGVVVHEPTEPGAPWIVQRDLHYIRAGADMAALLRSMDGDRDHAGLVQALGPPWTAPQVEKAVEQLVGLKLLAAGDGKRRRTGRLRFVAPLTVQLTLLRPERLLRALAPVIRLLATRTSLVLAAAVVLGGLVALAAQAPALDHALGRPLPLAVLLGVFVGSLATTSLHELGHGAVLAHHGGRPSRMGVMLFYLTPAFFCDVSDGWRLPRPGQRVAVALAGVAVQLVVSSCAALAAAAVGAAGGDADVRDGLLVFAVSSLVTGLLNLLPFVKLDGYLALMAHLDMSHLRDRAMSDARGLVAGALFGGTYRRELPELRWAPAFGLACLIFPLYLIGLAAALWMHLFLGTGAVGATMVMVGLGFLGYRAFLGTRTLIRTARAAGAGRLRIAAVSGLVAAVAGALLAVVPVPYSVTGGFVQDQGGMRLALADGADLDALVPGAPVTLYQRGLITRSTVGTAAVGTGAAAQAPTPYSAFMPFAEGDGLLVPALQVPLVTTGPAPVQRVGVAVVAAGDRSVAQWLHLTYVAPAWR